MSDELKPCPFCGTTNIEQGIDDLTNYYIGCADCGCQVGNNDSKGLERWNHRAENAELRTKLEVAQGIDERTEFTAWAKTMGYDTRQYKNGEFSGGYTSGLWECWQARAALNGATR